MKLRLTVDQLISYLETRKVQGGIEVGSMPVIVMTYVNNGYHIRSEGIEKVIVQDNELVIIV